jgi:HK97 gp10 family phage protein
MKMHLAFEGGKELAAALETLSPRVARRESLDALRGSAVPILREARDFLPTGPTQGPHLKDNLGTQNVSQGDDLTIAVGPEKRPDFVFWGTFLEFGTVKMSARAWLRPAFDHGVWDSLDILRTLLWASIKKRAPRVKAA